MQGNLATQLNNTENNIGLTIDTKSNVIKDALIYTPPQIRMKKTFTPKGSGTWRIKEPIFSQGASLGKWAIICDDRDSSSAETVGLSMLKSSKSIGVKVGKPKIFKVKTGRNQPNLAAQVMDIIASTSQADIFMLMFQKRTADTIYKRVKTECNQKYSKPTQFFTNWKPKDNRSLGNLSVMSNIVLQMACKRGYSLWKVQLPHKLNDNGRQAMIIGGDVFHMNSKDSVTSVVATLDKDFTQYYSVNSVQKRRGDDILHSIAEQVIDCKRKYASVNKQDPDLIIFFRDGIGAGSYDYVREQEIKTILGMLKENATDKSKVPKLAYIVVNKRINDRFFEQGNRGPQNPAGGLVIKSTVTNNNGFDYFMVAQNVNRGTATPTHYECLYNDTGLSADTFYELTYY